MLDFTDNWKNYYVNNEILPHTGQNGHPQISTYNKICRGCGREPLCMVAAAAAAKSL